MRSLSLMIKPASGKCNLRCSYCFYECESKQRQCADYGFMSLVTLEKLLQSALNATEELYVLFQGGEPTLAGLSFFQSYVEMLERINIENKPVHHALQTNGTRLTEEWAGFFAKYNFLIGISIDGMASVHNFYRKNAIGESSLNQVMQGLELLKKHRVNYNVLSVVTDKSLEKAEKIYDFFKKNGVHYQQYIPCIEEVDGNPSFLSAENYGHFLSRLFDLWERDVKTNQGIYIRNFENYLALAMGMAPDSCSMIGTCAKMLAVEADGSLFPCDFYMLDAYKLGNIHESSIEEALESENISAFIAESRALPEECKACPYFVLCRNGCKRDRDRDGLNRYCKSYQIFFAHAIPRLLDMAKKIKGIEKVNKAST